MDSADAPTSATGARTQSLFEDYPGCPQLPPPTVPSLRTPGALASIGFGDRRLTRRLVSAALWLARFPSFVRSGELERSLTTDVGGRPVACPLFSAAVPLVEPLAETDPCLLAGRLVRATREWHDAIRAGDVAPDRQGERRLESRGYLNLFGTRFAFERGSFRVGKTADVRHLLVCARGLQYRVELSLDGSPPEVDPLAATLRHIWTESRVMAGARPTIGALSGALPGTQTAGFARLLAQAGNREAYRSVLETFITVCLDLETRPSTDEETARVALISNPENRWYHASLQVVVFANGRACLVCNPDAGVTGNAMMRAAREILTRVDQTARSTSARPPRPAEVVTWDGSALPVERVARDLDGMRHDQPSTFELPRFGRRRVEALGLPPIELFVAGVQDAVARLTGEPASVSQFVGATGYRGGSHATAVVSTPELERSRQALAGDDVQAILARFAEAVESQRTVCRAARRAVPLPLALSLFRATRRGWRGRQAERLLDALVWLLRGIGLEMDPPGRDVVLSHPVAVDEAPLVGRPGVRLPYIRLFGLHYQVLADRTVFTVMPGREWTGSTSELASAIEHSLDRQMVLLSTER